MRLILPVQSMAMLQSFDAVLKDNHLEWSGQSSPAIAPGASIRVQVTVLEPEKIDAKEASRRAAEMMAALQEIAGRGGVQGISDPAQWQREMRAERELPGR